MRIYIDYVELVPMSSEHAQRKGPGRGIVRQGYRAKPATKSTLVHNIVGRPSDGQIRQAAQELWDKIRSENQDVEYRRLYVEMDWRPK